jgi:alpha-N-arabinofuranosidase
MRTSRKRTAADPADIFIFGKKPLGEVPPFFYGQFIELAGRCVNDGLYDPKSPHARPDGVRADVLEAIKALRPTHLRYPGGCAAAYFRWKDLVGTKDQRPRARLFRTTSQPQSTAFGIDEAWRFCREVGCELYYTINAHTQSTEDAANLVEYLNGTGATQYADLRRAHGRKEPYRVRLFSLGNEIYGDWQPGQKTAEEYAMWCREAIRQMKAVDPTIEITVCGLGRPNPEWDRTVLFHTLGMADRISVHNYFGRPIFRDSMVASKVCEQTMKLMDAVIEEAMDTTLGLHPRTVRNGGAPPVANRRPTLAFDEWNVWYRSTHGTVGDLEEIYDYVDGLTAATIFHVILRNTRLVSLSNISLAVNTLGSIFTDRKRMALQTIWHAQKMIRDAHETGRRVIETAVNGPTFAGKHERFFCGIVDPVKAKDETLPSLLHFGDVPALDVVASIGADGKQARLSVVQKLQDRPIAARFNFQGVKPSSRSIRVTRLKGGSLSAKNTLDQPNRVGTETRTEPRSEVVTLPPASLTVIEFDLA